MITERKTANAVGGKTARACDSCVRRRARWYCAADDAFLCQTCDGSVHSANQLASRHERVRLETSSFKLFGGGSGSNEPERTWHQGFTRKARTPRVRTKSSEKVKNQENINPFMPLVPEIGMEDTPLLNDDDEEKLLYRVPIFDPFAVELCNASNREMEANETFFMENKQEQECKLDDLQGFDLPSEDLELLEFAADVESLLGHGFNEESCGIEGLGFSKDCKEEDENTKLGFCFEESRMKVKDEDEEEEEEVEAILGCDLDECKETLDWDFDYESKMMMIEEEEDNQKEVMIEVEKKMMASDECKELGFIRRSSIVLRLNYEQVIDAWADQGSPWTTGVRPEFNPDDCWPDFMGVHIHSRANNRPYGGGGSSDGGREARVSRYREKRRNRLFSKKIRYEVRKLNAEKRPRMKGRFVKREAINGGPHGASNFPHYHIKK